MELQYIKTLLYNNTTHILKKQNLKQVKTQTKSILILCVYHIIYFLNVLNIKKKISKSNVGHYLLNP